jgi:glycogen(starch) synthase
MARSGAETFAPAIFASSFYPHIGGVEEAVRQLAAELLRRGSSPTVVTNRYPKTLPAHSLLAGIPVTRHQFRVPGAHWRHLAGWTVAAAPTHVQVARGLKSSAADLIHVQCVSSNASYALSSRRALRLPLVVTMQGELGMDASKAYQRSPYLRRLWRQSLDAADVITGCSQFVLDEAQEVYGSFAGRARMIPNGIRLTDYLSCPVPRSERPYILGIGRMVEQKGFDLLIDSFRALSGDWPDLQLILAGDGPSRSSLESQMEDSGLSSRIEFLGSVDHQSAVSLFQQATVFVLPSRHEPQGIVVLEAMAAGSPVVAARVGGVSEIVRDGHNGLLFEPEDTDSLAGAITKVLADEELCRQLVAAGRATAASHDWGHTTDAYLDVYTAVSG